MHRIVRHGVQPRVQLPRLHQGRRSSDDDFFHEPAQLRQVRLHHVLLPRVSSAALADAQGVLPVVIGRDRSLVAVDSLFRRFTVFGCILFFGWLGGTRKSLNVDSVKQLTELTDM